MLQAHFLINPYIQQYLMVTCETCLSSRLQEASFLLQDLSSNPTSPLLNSATPWVDPVAQQSLAQGQMPEPIMNFEGLMKSEGGGWTPPDTNGDVGPNHYIQTVNIALGIYDKVTGSPIVKLTYNEFLPGSSRQPVRQSEQR